MKLIRSATVSMSICLFNGILNELKDEGYDIGIITSPGEEGEVISKIDGMRFIPVEMQRHISPLKDIKSLLNLIKIFRKEKPDIVHSITPKAGLLSMMAAWICRVPVRIHTFTGLVFPTSTGLKQKILILTDKITCACATHINPEGEGVKNDLKSYKITKKPMSVLGHGNIKGVDLTYFDPENRDIIYKAKELKKGGVFTFIFVGRLVGDKGINELVRAFSKLNKKYKDIRLILVGPEEKELDPLQPETLKEIETNENIEAVGMQNDVRPWYLASDALVFPSYREGFPNVVMEAGAMKLPSIVTDINGSREIIIEGENGVIIPSRDEETLYDAMEDFITNRERVKNMGENARPLIKSRYEQAYVRKCLKDYYKNICKKIN